MRLVFSIFLLIVAFIVLLFKAFRANWPPNAGWIDLTALGLALFMLAQLVMQITIP